MIGVFLAILFACLAYLLVIALTGSYIIAVIAAILVLLGGFAYRGRFPGDW